MSTGINIAPSLPYKVYTALLTQSGGDDPDSIFGGNGSVLDFGQSFLIISNPDNYDLTIYGAANNNTGTWFVCNDPSSPVLGYTNSLELQVNYGAPVVTVLENTIGNIWFAYNGIGGYLLYRDSDFIPEKVFAILTNNLSGNIGLVGDNMALGFECYPNVPYIPITSTTNGVPTDGVLYNTPIEIRVYN